MNILPDFKYPKNSFLSVIIERLLNGGRPLQNLFSKAKLTSDIKNVVYLNWMVPYEKVEHLIPEGLHVEVYDGKVLLTILNYNHGNFRPKSLDPIKFIFGSPNQSNWRLYLKSEYRENKTSDVLFLTNVLSSFFYTFGSRFFSQILKAHWSKYFHHKKNGIHYHTKIHGERSNAPNLEVNLTEKENWQIPEDFYGISKDVNTLLKTICYQDTAFTKVNNDVLVKAKIRLNFDLETIKPLVLNSIKSETLQDLIQDSICFAFVIPELKFYSLGEKLLKT